jgi:hypothetical protein
MIFALVDAAGRLASDRNPLLSAEASSIDRAIDLRALET